MKLITLIFLFVFNPLLFAAEADHFSPEIDQNNEEGLIQDLEDSNELLTQSTHKMVKSVLDKINKNNSCQQMDEKELYKELKTIFSNHTKGKLVKEILYTGNYPLIKIHLLKSIYKDWSIFNGYLLGKKNASESPLALSPLIRIRDVTLGVDKLEHLFGMGYQYFDRAYLREKSIKRILKRGIFFEKTILGGNILATGVFSYADLAANFNGMRFWNHILQKRDDILGKEYNYGPYIVCQAGSWVQSKPIDFSQYMDLSVDESINCSKLASKGGVTKYRKILKENSLQCPRRPDLYRDLLRKYSIPTPGDRKSRPLSHWILNNNGIEKLSYFNEF